MTDTKAGEAGDLVKVGDVTPDIAAFFDHAKSLQVEDGDAVQERILRNLLAATTPADVLRSGEATPASAIYGVPIMLEGVRASESDFSDGPDLYLHLDAKIIASGDHVTVASGARDVVLKAIRLDQLGMLPVACRIEQSKKATKDGYYPVFLRVADDAGEGSF